MESEEEIEFDGYDMEELQKRKKQKYENHEGDSDTAIDIDSIVEAETGENVDFVIDGKDHHQQYEQKQQKQKPCCKDKNEKMSVNLSSIA